MTVIELSDQAVVKVYPIEPGLDKEQAEQLEGRLQKLLTQFKREGSAGAGAASCIEDGHILVIAWEPGSEPLSGCRHDKIARLLLQFEEQAGVAILNAPPLLVQVDGQWQAHTRGELKAQVVAGRIGLDNLACNTRCEDLGQWRRTGCTAAGAMWMRPIIERMQA